MTEAEKDVLREHGHEYGAATAVPAASARSTLWQAATACGARAAMNWL